MTPANNLEHKNYLFYSTQFIQTEKTEFFFDCVCVGETMNFYSNDFNFFEYQNYFPVAEVQAAVSK